MRACFLGQNICALGFGVATLQIPPLLRDDDEAEKAPVPTAAPKAVDQNGTPRPTEQPRPDAPPVTIQQRSPVIPQAVLRKMAVCRMCYRGAPPCPEWH